MNPFKFRNKRDRERERGDEGGVGPNRKGPLKLMIQNYVGAKLEYVSILNTIISITIDKIDNNLKQIHRIVDLDLKK